MMDDPYFTPLNSPVATLLDYTIHGHIEYNFDDDSSIEENGLAQSSNSSPVPCSSKNVITSKPSYTKSLLGVFEKSASESTYEGDETSTISHLKSTSILPPAHEETEEDYEDEDEKADSLEESDTTETESDVEDENGDFELGDLSADDEEEDNFAGYIPTTIPHLIEESLFDMYRPIWTTFKKIIEDDAGKDSAKPQLSIDDEEELKKFDMSEMQLNIETLFKANLFKQIAVIDELSKLLTGNSAIIGGSTKAPDIDDTPKEVLPAVYNKVSDHLVACSQKDQNKLYLIELWWAWIEDLMPECTTEFVKKFKGKMVERMRPKAFVDYDNDNGRQNAGNAAELKQYGVKLYDLQIFEDDEIASDYEADNGIIYYRKTTEENKSEDDEDEKNTTAESPTQPARKRKLTISGSPTPAKRIRADSNSNPKELEAFTVLQAVALSRRVSTLSHRSSMSPPILSPQAGSSKVNTSFPQTPIKDTSSLFSSPPTLMEKKMEEKKVKEMKPENAKKKQRRTKMKFKETSICFKLPYKGEREIPNEEEEDPTIWQGDGCDSDDIVSGLKMKFPLIHSHSGHRLSILKKKLAKISRRRSTVTEEDSEAETSHKKPQRKRKVSKIEHADKNIVPEYSTSSEYEENNKSSSEEESQKYTNCDSEEDPDEAPGKAFNYNGVKFEGSMLKKLIEAGILEVDETGVITDTTENEHLFGAKKHDFDQMNEIDELSKEIALVQNQLTHTVRQAQQQSKIMLDNIAFEGERRQCLKQIVNIETLLTESMEGPASIAEADTITEAFKQLSMIYESQGIVVDRVEDYDIEHIAIRSLNLQERFY